MDKKNSTILDVIFCLYSDCMNSISKIEDKYIVHAKDGTSLIRNLLNHVEDNLNSEQESDIFIKINKYIKYFDEIIDRAESRDVDKKIFEKAWNKLLEGDIYLRKLQKENIISSTEELATLWEKFHNDPNFYGRLIKQK